MTAVLLGAFDNNTLGTVSKIKENQALIYKIN